MIDRDHQDPPDDDAETPRGLLTWLELAALVLCWTGDSPATTLMAGLLAWFCRYLLSRL
ncbi:hypothetical protein [Actinokineospora inagensis]|uniref:hypothetical protein n=1 Tax=Actinokineospora inagensis TaxID=103730 RepID=UPI0004115537|nr:hypothetical protein [Actinokineospora inagensis]